MEQKNDGFRPSLVDKNAPIANYKTIILAYPIWWAQAPRIMDTFVESYDFNGPSFSLPPPAAAALARLWKD